MRALGSRDAFKQLGCLGVAGTCLRAVMVISGPMGAATDDTEDPLLPLAAPVLPKDHQAP